MKQYSRDEVERATLDYFKGDALATNVFISKYAWHDDDIFYELTPEDTHNRMAREFARISTKYLKDLPDGLSSYGKKRFGEIMDHPVDSRFQLLFDRFLQYFKDFADIIPQGSVLAVLGTDIIGSLSNCVTLPPIHDSYGGIMFTDQQLTQVFKRRGGAGVSISTLRPSRSPVNNVAKTSSGAISFMHRFSNTSREVGQGGRRSALMITMDCRHPNIEEFITVKNNSDKVTGANISVKFTDEFFKAVENDTEFLLRFPVDADVKTVDDIRNLKVTKTVRARDIWNKFVASSHKWAEPGAAYWDKITKYSTDHYYNPIVTSNPCQPSFATVLTPEGIREFGDVGVGDTIWSETGWTKIVKKWHTGKKEVLSYTTTAGTFIGTKEHQIVSKGVKIEVKDADKIDILSGVIPASKVDVIPEIVMDGLMIGDGSVHMQSKNKTYLLIGNNDTDYHDSIIGDLIVSRHAVKRDKAWKVITSITPNELPHTYLRLIPSRFMYGDKNVVASFLMGLYSANGSVIGNRIALKSTSIQLIKQVQIMLSSLGIRSYYTTNKPSLVTHHNGEYLSKQSYDLNITTDRHVFADTVGFLQTYKMEKLSIMSFTYNKTVKTHNIVETTSLGVHDVYDITVDNATHTYWSGGLNVSNCGEIFMANDSCRLIAVNMLNAVDNPYTDHASFNYERWYKSVYETQVLLDNLVDLELERVQVILDKIKADPEPDYIKSVEIKTWQDLYDSGEKYRRTGNGFTGLGDTLAALGLNYGNALNVNEKIAKVKLQAEWDASIDLAILRGRFDGFNMETEDKSEFIQMLKNEFPDTYERMSKYGRRNVSISTVAPTGSISMLAKNGDLHGVSGGIEPVFALWFTRRKKINNFENSKVDYTDENGEKWREFDVFHAGYLEWARNNSIEPIKENIMLSPYSNATAPEIDYIDRLKLQGTWQKYITHSISSTINLPSTVSEQKVSEIYLEAWKHGLKGVTIYRDGSRSGVLVTKKQEKRDAPKRPENLPCRIFNTKRLGKNWVVLVGHLNGVPYEVFAFENGIVKCEDGILAKRGSGVYDLICGGKIKIENITETHMTDESEAITRLLSLSLRHGTDIKYIIEQLDKSKGTVVNFSKVVNRTLKKLDGVDMSIAKKCPECDTKMIMVEGCSTCPNCGYSACG